MKKIKITLSILLSVITFLYSHGQTGGGIFEGDVTLTTQAEVDAFSYTEVTGMLTISGNDISNLSSLSQLTRAGNLILRANASLTDVSGLSALTEVYRIDVSDNPMLVNLDALSSVTVARDGITISNNAALESINGFSMLAGDVRGITISANPQLKSVNGFQSLTRLLSYDGGDLTIDNNASLTSIDGLSSLSGIFGKSGSIQITNNAALLNIDGLSSFQTFVCTATFLNISNNTSLKNLDGLTSLSQMGTDDIGTILIENNPALENIDGLSQLRAAFDIFTQYSIIRIKNNTSLSQCDGLKPLLVSLGGEAVAELIQTGNIEVSGNDSGCTLEEIIAGIPQSIYAVSLIDENGGSLIRSFDSVTVDLGNPYYTNTAVQAKTFPSPVGSVVFIIDNQLEIVDNEYPYALSVATLGTGTHHVTCELYSQADKQGQKGYGKSFVIDILSAPQICEGDVVLASQADVDAFTCKEVIGNLRISGSEIISLHRLGALKKVSGTVWIEDNTQLETLDGLSSLDSIGGGLYIRNDGALVDISALSSLKVVGDLTIENIGVRELGHFTSLNEVNGLFYIAHNHSLIEIRGPESLTDIKGGLTITGNSGLNAVRDFVSLTTVVGGIEIFDNPNLVTLEVFGPVAVRASDGGPGHISILQNKRLTYLSGFPFLTEIGDINIESNDILPSINAFRSLSRISGHLNISNNASLKHIQGFNNLTEIVGAPGTDAGLTITGSAVENIDWLLKLKTISASGNDQGASVTIENNSALKNINGLSALSNIMGYTRRSLTINKNAVLENIDGLSSLVAEGGDRPLNINVTKNPMLQRCNGLARYFESLGEDKVLLQVQDGIINLSENGAGCTVEEILNSDPIGPFCYGNFLLSSQAEVDAFSCAELNGHLTISGSDITDLKNLSVLTKISGSLNIVDNPNLESLDGLSGFATVGGIVRIQSNQVLSNFDALNSLKSVGGLFISSNPALLDIGLSSFQSLENGGELYINSNENLHAISGFNKVTVAGPIEISNNPKLVSISGFDFLVMTRHASLNGLGSISIYQNDALVDLECFSALTSVGSIRISMNNRLTSLDGFLSVSTIYGELEITSNASLKSINGFQRLTVMRSIQREVSAVGIIISNNPSLESLTGLSSLKTIDSQYTNRVEISNNASLKKIVGLSSLVSIVGEGFLSFEIKNNTALDNIEGLLALTHVGAILGYFKITISQNPSLTQCCPLRPLLEHLDERFNLDTLTARKALVIAENGGCTVEHIISCGPQKITNLDIIDLRTGHKVYTFDNDSVTFDLAHTDPHYLGIQAHTLPSIVGSVEFILGKVRHTENNHPYLFDPPQLDQGIYIVKADVYSKPNRQGAKGVGKTLTIIVKNSAAVESYELVDATGKPIRPLQEGDKLNVKDVVFSKSVNIRANVSDNHITSVRFFLNGVFVRREMSAPFAFNGDNNGNYYPWKPQPGEYTLLAVPYVVRNNKEYEGKSLEIHFTVEAQESPIAVESFDLVDTFGNILRQLNDGDQINIQDPMFKAINIVANTSGQVGSVNFWLNNKSYRTENGVPYTLAGDQNGKFNAWSPGVGDYKLSAIPHFESNAKGTIGKSLTVHFSVVNEKAVTATRLITSTGLNEEPIFQEGFVGVSIYPVPVGNELNVKIDDVAAGKDAMLTVVNFQGLTLYKNSYEKSQTINTLELKPGVYMLQIVNNSGFRRVMKFIKK